MKQIKKTYILIGILIFIAYLCRFPIHLFENPNTKGAIRFFIYFFLFMYWMISIQNRIIQKQVCHYMIVIAILMIFWLTIRYIKYDFLTYETFPNLKRYAWYCYYLPLLFIPTLAVFVSISIRQPENYKIPKKDYILWIPAIVLFLIVITNDFHQLVFTFPALQIKTEYNNGYGILYFFIYGWMLICIFITLINMTRKKRNIKNPCIVFIPCIPVFILSIYMICYFLAFKWLRILFGDVVVFNCVMYISTLELCIYMGLIQANTHYVECFDAFTYGAKIMDSDLNILLSTSQAKKDINKEIINEAIDQPVILDDGYRLSTSSIKDGYVFWLEDISNLMEIVNELEEIKENLEDENEIIKQENELRIKEMTIHEQNRLFNLVQEQTSSQIQLMDSFICQMEQNKDINILKKMIVIGTYLKRRSNLIFIADQYNRMEAMELFLCLKESMESLEIYGISCGINFELKNDLESRFVIQMYDCFEKIIESSLDTMSSMFIVVQEKETIQFIVYTQMNIESFYMEDVDIQQEEDEVRLCLTIRKEL
ncbi:hypothetical protein [Floccifex sp.]|uniref:hypothetical protein n=1 Tax=Floccifex sp. TaxID=2815810 RepID=UPI003EFF4E9B